jgi:hypothetical protein
MSPRAPPSAENIAMARLSANAHPSAPSSACAARLIWAVTTAMTSSGITPANGVTCAWMSAGSATTP